MSERSSSNVNVDVNWVCRTFIILGGFQRRVHAKSPLRGGSTEDCRALRKWRGESVWKIRVVHVEDRDIPEREVTGLSGSHTDKIVRVFQVAVMIQIFVAHSLQERTR